MTRPTFPAAGDALMAEHDGPLTPLDVAGLYLGLQEGRGTVNHPLVLAMLRLDNSWVAGDDTAWCSAFVNWVAFHLGLPRSRSLAARSWLRVGQSIDYMAARAGDVVVLTRGGGPQPGADVLDAPGHVAFFVGWAAEHSLLLRGGNQSDGVSDDLFKGSRVLGVRRL